MAPRANWKSSAVRSRVGSWIRALREARIVFRTVGWGKLVISFWCEGLVHGRLDRRRTVARHVAAMAGE
jgi:hypothetical protein